MVRATELRAAEGVVIGKTVKPASVYRQYPDRKEWGPAEIPIAESVVFEIRMPGVSDPVRYSLNKVVAEHFEVGQKVRIEYVKRAIVPFHTRIYMRDMKPLK